MVGKNPSLLNLLFNATDKSYQLKIKRKKNPEAPANIAQCVFLGIIKTANGKNSAFCSE